MRDPPVPARSLRPEGSASGAPTPEPARACGSRTNGEFDVVTYDENGYVFYEAKFRKGPITDKMVSDEIEQVRATGLECYKYGFFSRSGFSAAPRHDTEFITLSQIYA